MLKARFYRNGPQFWNSRHLLVTSNPPDAVGRSFNLNNKFKALPKSPPPATHHKSTPRWKAPRSSHMCWFFRQSQSDFLVRNKHHCNNTPTRSSPRTTLSSLPRKIGTAMWPRWTTYKLITSWGSPIPTPRRTEQFQPQTLTFVTSAEYFQHTKTKTENILYHFSIHHRGTN